MKRFLLIFLVLGLFQAKVLGQEESEQQRDSVNSELLRDYQGKMAEFERQQREDSIRRAELEAQINALRSTDNQKRRELQDQLNQIKQDEARKQAEKKAQIDSLRSVVSGFPVTGFFKDTLFLIYNKLGSFSARERADAISQRIRNLAGMIGYNDSTLRLQPSENTVDIIAGETTVVSVTEEDALWNNTSKSALAGQYRDIIAGSISNYHGETSFVTIIKEIGMALLVLAVVALIIYYASKLFRWTAKKIGEQEGKMIRGLKLKNYTLFDAKRQVRFFTGINTVLKWLVIVILVYVSLPIVFSMFPWTQNFAETLFGYVVRPLKRMASGVWNYLPDLFTILVIFFVFRYVVKGIRFLKQEIEHEKLRLPGFYPDWANPTFQILRVILYAFMFVLIFPYLPGSDSPIFKGVSVFLGFLFTFGSAGSLSNVIAGIVLTYMRLFKIGDRVKIGEVVGDVTEKSLLVTRIRTIKNEIISIPNSTVMSSHTINYSSEALNHGIILHTTVSIGYDVPWKKMHEALVIAAGRTNHLLKDPAPFVLQKSLDDFYVSYEINAYTKEASKQAVIYSDLHQHIQDCCNEMGIEILSPHYRAARDGNRTTIPPDYLPDDYKPSGFNLDIRKESE